MQQTDLSFGTDKAIKIPKHSDFGAKIGGAKKDLTYFDDASLNSGSYRINNKTTSGELKHLLTNNLVHYSDLNYALIDRFVDYSKIEAYYFENYDMSKPAHVRDMFLLAYIYQTAINMVNEKPNANAKVSKIHKHNLIVILFYLVGLTDAIEQGNKADFDMFFKYYMPTAKNLKESFLMNDYCDIDNSNAYRLAILLNELFLSLTPNQRQYITFKVKSRSDCLTFSCVFGHHTESFLSHYEERALYLPELSYGENPISDKDWQTFVGNCHACLKRIISHCDENYNRPAYTYTTTKPKKPKTSEAGAKTTTAKAKSYDKSDFSIWNRLNPKAGQKAFFISLNRKKDRLRHPLMEFDSSEDALNCLKSVDGMRELNEKANAFKQSLFSLKDLHLANSDNIRNGQDYRQGKDVSTEQFAQTFGLRAVEFGNWVSQGKGFHDRADLVNKAYDALCDLANLLGKPKEFIGLGGNLAIAFGSRGSGNASAHYEPTYKVINLTKTKGNGTLAHEWFHAYDHYLNYSKNNTASAEKTLFSRTISLETLLDNAFTGNNHLMHLYEQLPVSVKGDSNYHNATFMDVAYRSAVLDASKGSTYFSTNVELVARFFESFVHYTLTKQGLKSEFLNNHTTRPQDETDFYPYVNSTERESERIDLDFDVFLTAFDLK